MQTITNPGVPRRKFFSISICGVAATTSLVGQAPRSYAQEKIVTINAALRKKSQSIDGELVKRFVVAAHRDLAQVKEMLQSEPALVNATVDWGGGDFEDALGGASHMGKREIAEFLIARGGRPNLFTYAMLGLVEPVKAMLTAMPDLVHVPGPHGISLLKHAQKGGSKAQEAMSLIRHAAEK